ncbi:MAG: hypothetical protein IJ086_11950, partial [Clostridium sp.]|nr:hypothetical protein [Clostridium sp.]
GFEFEDCSAYWMYKKIEEAYDYFTKDKENFKQMQYNGMNKGFSWHDTAKKYKRVYETLVNTSTMFCTT